MSTTYEITEEGLKEVKTSTEETVYSIDQINACISSLEQAIANLEADKSYWENLKSKYEELA